MTRRPAGHRGGTGRAEHGRALPRRAALVVVLALLGGTVGATTAELAPRAAGLVLGLALGVVAALLVVRAPGSLRVHGVADVRRATGLPVVGQLPSSVRRAARPGTTGLDASARTALRETVQNLRVLDGGHLPRVLLLARGERATDSVGVDAGLARAAVELGGTCALVHADPEAHDLARSATDTDLALPRHTASDPSGYDRVPVPDVVTASALRFVRTGVDRFFEDLRATYQLTVLQVASDSAPAPLRTVLPEADAVVLVARSGRTRVDVLQALVGELQSHGVEPLGVVLTGVPPRRRVLLRPTWTDADVVGSPPTALAHPADTRTRSVHP